MTNDDLPDLSALDKKIASTKKSLGHGGYEEKEVTPAKQALRIGADLVAGVAVGMTLGWYADDYLHTKPLFMFVGLAVGFAAGMRLMLSGSKLPEDEA